MPTTKQKNIPQPETPSKSSQVRALLATGMSVADIAKQVGCTPNLVYVAKANRKTRTARKAPRRRPAAGVGLADLTGIVEMVKNSERERAQLRGALEKIQAVLADALA